MTTRLDKPIKREITVGGEAFVLTLMPDAVTITPKGRRKGKTFAWAELWSGEQELTTQLRASVAGLAPTGAPERPPLALHRGRAPRRR